MPYCSYCGVEVDEKTVTCPLCKADIPAASKEPPLFTGDYPHREHRLHYRRRPFTEYERRVVLWLFSFILAVPLAVVVAVNLYAQGSVTWSVYPMVAFGGVWVVVALGLFIRGFWKLFVSYIFLAVILSLLFSFLAGMAQIFLEWSVPIIFGMAILAAICIAYGRKVEKPGANLAAVILWALTALCVGIDLLVTVNIGSDRFPLSWSLIVASALVPTGGLLMYIHYRFARTFSVKRYFNA